MTEPLFLILSNTLLQSLRLFSLNLFLGNFVHVYSVFILYIPPFPFQCLPEPLYHILLPISGILLADH